MTCPYHDDNYACDAILQELEIKNVFFLFHWISIDSSVLIVNFAATASRCRKSNCLITSQAIHEGAKCKAFQDRVNHSAETDEDASRWTKEMMDVNYKTIGFSFD